MCTAITMHGQNFYFGRNLDLDCSYGEMITFTPRNFPLDYRNLGIQSRHYAILGMAHVVDGVPLYFDGFNEKGLAMAALNFEGFAFYHPMMPGRDNIPHFELISWVLSQCASVSQGKVLLDRLNITDQAFSDLLPVSSLHWILADQRETITIEAVKDGLKIYPNPVGVLTNNPSFETQLFQLNNYMHLSPEQPMNRFSDQVELWHYSRGMGALGLPGDLSSQSRFVRAAFTKLNSVTTGSPEDEVSQFFHILDTVSQTRGCCKAGDGYEITVYSSCCDLNRRIYCYTTYENRCIHGITLEHENLEGSALVRYPLNRKQEIQIQNKIVGQNSPN